MKSSTADCECGHEKRDHRAPMLGKHAHGECKVCLCKAYSKPVKAPRTVSVGND